MKHTENKYGKICFTKEFTDCNLLELLPKILTFALIYGVDNLELILKNTYCKNEYFQIINFFNELTKNELINS